MTEDKIKKLTEYWIKGAQEDLVSSKEILDQTSRWVHALFFLHLSLEKILKAYYCHKHQTHAPLTHNLLFLVEKNQLDLPALQKSNLERINEFNLECRYPDEIDKLKSKITTEKAQEYWQKGEEIFLWISQKLK
jgi:hypothetical protein